MALLAALLTACGSPQGREADGDSDHNKAHVSDAKAALASRTAGKGVGLFTSLPILWNEAQGPEDLLSARNSHHWLLDKGTLPHFTPLDVLADPSGVLPLPERGVLMMAQPRPLTPVENVALDRWVRDGGHLLLFADPMLTQDSAFAIGDPRRPQDVVLLSPILAHWGLELQFDDSQPAGEHFVLVSGRRVPIALAGRFARIGENPGCAIEDSGLLADCEIGAGRVVAIADAAMLGNFSDSSVRDACKSDFLALLERTAAPR